MPDTIAAIATGYSVSAIGIIRISGEQAIPAAEKLFRAFRGEPVSRAEDRKLIYDLMLLRNRVMLKPNVMIF